MEKSLIPVENGLIFIGEKARTGPLSAVPSHPASGIRYHILTADHGILRPTFQHHFGENHHG
jgi:hypothetical protein